MANCWWFDYRRMSAGQCSVQSSRTILYTMRIHVGNTHGRGRGQDRQPPTSPGTCDILINKYTRTRYILIMLIQRDIDTYVPWYSHGHLVALRCLALPCFALFCCIALLLVSWFGLVSLHRSVIALGWVTRAVASYSHLTVGHHVPGCQCVSVSDSQQQQTNKQTTATMTTATMTTGTDSCKRTQQQQQQQQQQHKVTHLSMIIIQQLRATARVECCSVV